MKNDFLNKFLENTALKIAFAIIGLIGTVITIFAFLQEKKVEISYEIVSNTNVLDFNAEIGKLEVIYDSTNLKKSHENLRIYTIKIINSGNQNLLKEFYDDNDPLGLQLSSGKIIEQPEVIQSSNDYLTRNVKIHVYDNNIINFSQVIIESGEYYIIKLLVLHKTEIIPQITSCGKIAGQNNIQIINTIDVKEKLPFWKEAYYGNIWVQILRLISYFILGIVIIIISISVSEFITEKKRNRQINKNIADFKAQKTYRYSKMDDAIFDRYKSDSPYVFNIMQQLINNEDYLNETFEDLSKQLNEKKNKRYGSCEKHDFDNWSIIERMQEDGIIFRNKERLIINHAMKETLDKFVVFLMEKDERFKELYHLDLQNNKDKKNNEKTED